jgi:ubiquinol-cytochrome c reductase cytochrome b subunit
MLRATNDVLVWVLTGILALTAAWTYIKSNLAPKAKIAACAAAFIAAVLLNVFDAKFWGVVVMGAAVIILFFLPWLDKSPVKSIRYRPDWHKWMYGVFVVFFVVLSYLGIQAPTTMGTLIAQIGTLYYFGFFLLMPWWSQLGTFKAVPDRVTFAAH